MSLRNSKYHNYVQIASLILLAVLSMFLSPAANALGTKVHNISGMTLGANIVNVGVRVLDVSYLKHLKPYIAHETRNGIATAHADRYEFMCMEIAKRLIRLNVPVTEITITPINITGLGWKTKTCTVNPVVNITVD